MTPALAGSKPDLVPLDSVCLHEETVIDLIKLLSKTPGKPEAALAALKEQIKAQECVEFEATKLPVSEYGHRFGPVHEEGDTSFIFDTIRILKYWGLKITRVHDI